MTQQEQKIANEAKKYSGFTNHEKIFTLGAQFGYSLACNEDRWVRVDGTSGTLPEIDTLVEVVTEYESNASGKKVAWQDRFMGFMDEQGDLIISGSDDSYGWNFIDCVVMWRKPSPRPASPH